MLPLVNIGAAFAAEAREMLEQRIFARDAGEMQDTSETQRRIYNFGYSYNRMQTGDRTLTPIPSHLRDLCAASRAKLAPLAAGPLPEADAFDNCIISVYEKGFRLQPHIDADPAQTLAEGGKYSFYFGENIIGVVLEADEAGSLYFLKNNVRESLPEHDGTAFLLSGPHRHYPHGVSEVARRRVSATFRTVHFCQPA